MITHVKKDSAINDKFLSIASDCVAKLRELSDAGAGVWPIHIGIVQDEIVKALANVYFLGLDKTKTARDASREKHGLEPLPEIET